MYSMDEVLNVTMAILLGSSGLQRVTLNSDATDPFDGSPEYKLNNVTRSMTTGELRRIMESTIDELKRIDADAIPNNYVITTIMRYANLSLGNVTRSFDDPNTPVGNIVPMGFDPRIPPVINFMVYLTPPSGGRKSKRSKKRRRTRKKL